MAESQFNGIIYGKNFHLAKGQVEGDFCLN